MNSREVLQAAARYIDECGWTQGSYGVSGGPRCALGAILHVSDDSTAVVRAAQRLKGFLGIDITVWNDAKGRTRDEIVAAMRAAAAEPAP